MAHRQSHSSSDSYSTTPTSYDYPRSSAETYASTLASDEDLIDETPRDSEFDVPECDEILESNLRPSSPSDFAKLFPSTRRMYIRHDDTTFDGNMNLRVDTEEGQGANKTNIQLFHMRMHNLKRREFSIRRYERASGREVCHSARKYAKPAAECRPALTRSVSNALASIRGKSALDVKRSNSIVSHSSKRASTRRKDSGYASNDNDDEDDEPEYIASSADRAKSMTIPTNTTKLEFSNYAQIEVKRQGVKSSKRYDFEYWGHQYSWKRVVEKTGANRVVSFHLVRDGADRTIAHVMPELRSPRAMAAEQAAGQWVPPCSFWIGDKSILEAHGDVAEVIVSTALIALVDDCIKRHFHSTKPKVRQLGVPHTPLKVDVEFYRPKAMVEQIFKRRSSNSSSKERDPVRSSPLRFHNAVRAC